jgi:uncharacterized membrane protein YkvA (DUF1232 family)
MPNGDSAAIVAGIPVGGRGGAGRLRFGVTAWWSSTIWSCPSRYREGSAGTPHERHDPTHASMQASRCNGCYREGAVVDLVRTLLVALVVLLASWGLLVVLAKRLPPGILRDLAGFLPACLTLARRLRADPRVPRRAKLAVLLAGLWVLSPIDLIPEFLPVIGPLDDVVVVALALRYAARQVPREVLYAAWPAEPRLLARLIGEPVPASD